MENNLKVFTNDQFGEVRTVEINGEPHFVAADVCRALEITNVGNAISRLDDDEKGSIRSTDVTSNGGNPNLSVVTESGLYSLVLGSRKPEAKAFKRWITHDVIPAIRKHGGYLTPAKMEQVMNDPDAWIKMLTAIKDERARNADLNRRNANLLTRQVKDAPKVELAEAISEPDGSVLIRDFEKLLRSRGYQIKTNGLYKWMESNNLIEADHGRTKKFGCGYSATRQGIKNGITANRIDSAGRITAAIITPAGQEYILDRADEIANQQIKITVADKPTNAAMTIYELQKQLTQKGLRLPQYRYGWLYGFLLGRKLIKVQHKKGKANVYMASPVSIKCDWLENKLNSHHYISSVLVTPAGAEYITELVRKES